MNTSIKVLAGLSLLAALTACNQKATFTSESFVRFDSSAVSANEDAGTIKIPVYAYTSDGSAITLPRGENGPASVNFEVVNGSAEKDVDFTVSPASGVINFDGSVANIEITIKNRAGEYTGNQDFYIVLTSASDGYKIGASAVGKTKVTIKDLDHPLAAILGNYTADATDNWGDRYTIAASVEQVEGSVTKVTVKNICPYSVQAGYAHTFEGIVSDDHKTLTVPTEQWIVQGGLLFVAVNVSGGKLVYEDALVFDIDEENHTLTTKSGYGAMTSGGWYDLFTGGGIVFSRK